MRSEHSADELRRYVLGASTEEESAGIERDYFEDAEFVDHVRAAEDDLVDDYVSDQLAAEERERFERHYLSTPCHSRRVAVARALRTAASAKSSERRRSVVGWWPAAGLAAALVILVVGGVWILSRGAGPETVALDSPPTATAPAPPPTDARVPDHRKGEELPRLPGAPAPPRAAPVVVAFSISPILVRGADQPATLRIAAGTDLIRLHLQGETTDRRLQRARAIVRTVAGDEIWTGPATPVVRSTPNAFAYIDIPADRLRPDDYIIELLQRDAGGREVEINRYFFRVREP